jgi:1-acyl-sn-glycerol-3-phosphate acyltransferase
MHDWLPYLWYEANFWASMVGMTLGFSLRTQGQQHVPRTGPALLIANHQSFLDTVPIGLAVRRHLCYLARSTLFDHRTLAWIMRSLNAIAINQDGFAREGLKAILEQLQAGRAVLIFPEGERTWDGDIQPLRPGIHLLIKKVEMPIVPIGLAGAYDCWPRWRPYPVPAPLLCRPGKGGIAVAIRPPIPARHFAGRPREQILQELFVELQKAKKQAERLRRKPESGAR